VFKDAHITIQMFKFLSGSGECGRLSHLLLSVAEEARGVMHLLRTTCHDTL